MTVAHDEMAISDMETYGRGWSWTLVRGEEGYGADDTVYQVAYACHTNQDGEGLWVNGKQVAGTSQFHLSANKQTAKRQILRRGM